MFAASKFLHSLQKASPLPNTDQVVSSMIAYHILFCKDIVSHSFTSQDLTPYDFDTSSFMTFTKRLQHLFKPFKGTVFESAFLCQESSAVLPGISAFFPGISAPGVFNFGLVLLVCAHTAQETFKTKTHVYDMMLAKFPGGGGNLSVGILCFLNGGTVPVRNAQRKPQNIFNSYIVFV